MPYQLDAFTNVQTGYELGRNGDVFLPDEAALGYVWTVPVDDQNVSRYPPGAALHVAPLFAIWPSDSRIENLSYYDYEQESQVQREIRVPPLAPAAIATATIAAIAMGLVAVASNRLVSSWLAIGAGLVLGLGTATWGVASHQLWQHGPAMMWIAAGTVMSVHKPLGAGLAFAIAAITRPHTAVIGLSVAGARWISDRKLWPAVGMAALTSAGVLAFLVYTAWLLGNVSVSGGYGDSMITRLLSSNLGWYAGNILSSFVDPARGLFVYSPFLLLLIPGLPSAWRDSPWWVRGAAVGGVIYLLVQLKANRFTGGGGFFSYRYPLEALTAWAPLLVVAYERWAGRRPFAQKAFVVLVAYSVLLQAFGVMYLGR
jgi:alpha-1,2-mannosyltransferase